MCRTLHKLEKHLSLFCEGLWEAPDLMKNTVKYKLRDFIRYFRDVIVGNCGFSPDYISAFTSRQQHPPRETPETLQALPEAERVH